MDFHMMERMLLFQELQVNTSNVIFSVVQYFIRDLNTWLLIKFMPDQQEK